MSNRNKKRAFGAGRGDRSSVNGGRHPNTRGPLEGSYKNRYLVHAITSLTGCVVEVRKTNREVYQGVLSTISYQGDVLLEMASLCVDSNNEPSSKSVLVKSLTIPWSDVAVVSSLPSNNSTKDIFKTDHEIGARSNGVSGPRELQRFEFDEGGGGTVVDSSGITDRTVTLDYDDSVLGRWSPEAMFDANEKMFNVNTSFNPEMSEYTTSLVLKDNEEDKLRAIIADKKAREIEQGIKDQGNGIDDVGTEEELFSAVIPTKVDQLVQSEKHDTDQTCEDIENRNVTSQHGNEPVQNEKESDHDTDSDPLCATQNENESKVDDETGNESSAVIETESSPSTISSTINDSIESETKTRSPQSQTTSPPEDVKKPTFKLNPDAMEFKPSSSGVMDTPPASSSPPNPHLSLYTGTRGPRQKNPRGPRPSSFSDQQGLYGYQVPLQAGIRPGNMIHPQATSQLPASIASSILMRQPMATPIIGQHLYSPIAQSPLGQQLYVPASQSAAMFAHPHSLGPNVGGGVTPHQPPPVVYLPPPQSYQQQGGGGYIGHPSQLRGTNTGMMAFSSQTQQMGK